MQQAYVNAYAHLGQFAERARFGDLADADRRPRGARPAAPPWPFRGGRRDAGLGGAAMDLIGRSERNPEQQALRGEMRAILEAAFEAIPEIYRTVFMLREVEGLGTADAAECLSVSEDVVKTRFFRRPRAAAPGAARTRGPRERRAVPAPPVALRPRGGRRAGPPRSRAARAAALQLPRRRVPRGRTFAGRRADGILRAAPQPQPPRRDARVVESA